MQTFGGKLAGTTSIQRVFILTFFVWFVDLCPSPGSWWHISVSSLSRGPLHFSSLEVATSVSFHSELWSSLQANRAILEGEPPVYFASTVPSFTPYSWTSLILIFASHLIQTRILYTLTLVNHPVFLSRLMLWLLLLSRICCYEHTSVSTCYENSL